jgi:hypothetical protein
LSSRGFFRLVPGHTVHHFAHQRRFCSQLSVYRRFYLQFSEVTTPGKHLHFHSQLIARHYGPAESRVIHGDKVQQFFIAVWNL